MQRSIEALAAAVIDWILHSVVCPEMLCLNLVSVMARRKYRKITLEMLGEIARQRGGVCLSRRYINSTTPLWWRCAEGHRWQTKPMSVLLGHWCPRCMHRARPRAQIPGPILAAAKRRGGTLLSKIYLKASQHLRWRCARGHEWEATWNSVRDGTWCPKCFRIRPVDLAQVRKLAERFGGVCVSRGEAFVGSSLDWKCKQGHRWRATIAQVRRTGWCPRCRTTKPTATIGEMHRIARARGGRCLSTRPPNARILAKEPLDWECADGHRFRGTPDNMKIGEWCPVCYAGERPDIALMRRIARLRGGRCLSDRYVNDRTRLRWQCKKGHEWLAQPNRIKAGGWCLRCAIEKRRGGTRPTYSILDMQALAEAESGSCLSTEYSGMHVPLEWRCSQGHVWTARPNQIKRGTWCPECDRHRRRRRQIYRLPRGRSDIAIQKVPVRVARARRARRKRPFWL